MPEGSHRIEGARYASVLRYGGALWVNGYWARTTISIELRPVEEVPGRVVLLGPPVAGEGSVSLDLGECVALEAFAHALADWLETPALDVRCAERAWARVARRLATSAGMIAEGIAA